ncbi:hypothetical protein CWI75_00950 [Kineobactrum sediminis]|uniref:CheW-like domain-containing protein n=1 Tax=Kineobactrum sediminis TaxID=1905677 RepID=A0A2N5Y6D3_9GAMM|nr:hypothetical protein [Kineobactrum sediminis]PLW83955.1 hypothetical protein CWI75_00950 [Kineobactrum sediminis]
MTGARQNPTAAEQAIDSYMSELLQELPEEPIAGSSQTAPDQANGYYLFEVLGLHVAVAGDRVDSEVALPQVLEGARDATWYCSATVAGRTVTVIDTARLMLPADLAPYNVPLAERAQRMLLLDEGEWAIAIEETGEEVAIDIQAVSWRGPTGRRAWLAGTLASKRCVLLDLDGLRRLVQLPVSAAPC